MAAGIEGVPLDSLVDLVVFTEFFLDKIDVKTSDCKRIYMTSLSFISKYIYIIIHKIIMLFVESTFILRSESKFDTKGLLTFNCHPS